LASRDSYVHVRLAEGENGLKPHFLARFSCQGHEAIRGLCSLRRREPALPFVRLAFAGTQVALDATVIEVVPPLPENDSRLDHLAMACAHTLP
jgi:hypothetical protein